MYLKLYYVYFDDIACKRILEFSLASRSIKSLNALMTRKLNIHLENVDKSYTIIVHYTMII